MSRNYIKVLIIDDDDDSCDGVKILLSFHEKYKFKVDDCKTLKEALNLNLNNYDIIILDMLLPDSKGVDLYKSISSLTNTPIIILSGYSDLARDAAKAGAQGYLLKPVSHDVLVQTIIFSIERSKLVNKLREEKKRFEMVMEGISDSIIIYETNDGENFKIVDMNRSAEKLENIVKSKVIGLEGEKVFPYIKKFNFNEIFKEVYKNGTPKEDGLRKYNDGTWRTNYIYKIPENDIVSICYDKTDIVKILKSLEEKERMLRCSFNFNRDMIFITDMNYNILDRNRSFNKNLNYHYKNDVEINIKNVWKEKEKCEKFFEKLKRKGQNLNVECTFISKDGNEIYCIISAYILEDKIYYFAHDITKEKISSNIISKSEHILSDIVESKSNIDLNKELDEWKEEENVRIVLRKEKINEIDKIINDIQGFIGKK